MLGDYLRVKREESGLSLKELSEKTRIRLEYLKALESGEYGRIPGEVFVRGYIREYMRCLSTDPEEALSLYESEKPAPIEPEPLLTTKKTLPPSSRYRNLIFYFLILLFLVPLTIFAVRLSKNNRQATPSPTGVPSLEKVVKMIPAPVKTAEADFTNKHLLEISAIEDSWVFIQIDNNISYSMLLKAGEKRSWTGEKGFYLKTGNAGGIRITFDGKKMGAPGKRGHIAKLSLPQTPDQPAE